MTEAKARLPGLLPGFPDAGSAGRQPGWSPGGLAWPMRSSRVVPRWAVACAGLSPALLTVAWLAADILQPASYSPVRQTISALAGHGGTDRWLMTGALFLVAGCHLAAAAGLTGVRWPARLLLVIAGLCSAGIAASPVTADGPTSLHLAWTAVGAVTIAVWPAVAGWRAPPRPVITGARGPAMVTMVFVALLAWVVVETRYGSDLGLAERLTSSIQTCWPFVVAVMLRRATPRTPRADPADAGAATPGFERVVVRRPTAFLPERLGHVRGEHLPEILVAQDRLAGLRLVISRKITAGSRRTSWVDLANIRRSSHGARPARVYTSRSLPCRAD